jgi:hypothetical protein
MKDVLDQIFENTIFDTTFVQFRTNRLLNDILMQKLEAERAHFIKDMVYAVLNDVKFESYEQKKEIFDELNIYFDTKSKFDSLELENKFDLTIRDVLIEQLEIIKFESWSLMCHKFTRSSVLRHTHDFIEFNNEPEKLGELINDFLKILYETKGWDGANHLIRLEILIANIDKIKSEVMKCLYRNFVSSDIVILFNLSDIVKKQNVIIDDLIVLFAVGDLKVLKTYEGKKHRYFNLNITGGIIKVEYEYEEREITDCFAFDGGVDKIKWDSEFKSMTLTQLYRIKDIVSERQINQLKSENISLNHLFNLSGKIKLGPSLYLMNSFGQATYLFDAHKGNISYPNPQCRNRKVLGKDGFGFVFKFFNLIMINDSEDYYLINENGVELFKLQLEDKANYIFYVKENYFLERLRDNNSTIIVTDLYSKITKLNFGQMFQEFYNSYNSYHLNFVICRVRGELHEIYLPLF